MRIVTTLPSATETVAALGLEPVGVSHECDYPPSAASAPAVTSSRIDASGSSGEIDHQVLETSDTEDGVYDVDVETLAELDPDVIVTQGMCDVCAVDVAIIEDAADRIEADPEIVPTDPHSVDDVLADLERIGRAVGREERARKVRRDLESRLDAVRERTTDIAAENRPRVAIFDWTDPVMIAGHWTADLVDWAGGEYGLAEAGERSRPREWDAIRAYDPEVVVVAPCGFDLEQTARNRTDLTERDGWDELTAVQEGRVWAMDGDHYLNRPGPRLVETLEALAPIVQPDRFDGPDPAIAVPFDDLETLGSETDRDDDARVEAASRAEVDSSP
ncbi:cobalamin-binding protein [Natrinema longum]|uniref:Cobalamin-binding protein n=1 Tax=Natrinema longum TaxID=370324 RepID=A0A8A2UCA4_9EURY|nr:cobalamin-binding protein [Natrinema longum]MBZ6495705.1 cobalamin-binding protein [Natrinema longum]QSW86336.1 cobalamin-binding protein [Natrinema longum]